MNDFEYIKDERGYVTLRGRAPTKGGAIFFPLPHGHTPLRDRTFEAEADVGLVEVLVMASGPVVVNQDTAWTDFSTVGFPCAALGDVGTDPPGIV